MQRSNKVFTSSELKGALWVVVGCLIIASLGAAADRVMRPSLGWYGQDYAVQPLQGVVEAQPLG